MGPKLYVGGLPSVVEELQLNKVFAQHGTVMSVQVITDARTGRQRGFALVQMATSEEASQAIASLHGVEMDGHILTVREAVFQN